MRLASFMAVAHQPGLLQDAKMLGHRRLRDPGLSRQSPDRLLAVAAQPLEDGPPGRIGEGSEKHVVSIGHWINNPLAMDRYITARYMRRQAGDEWL